MKYIILLLLITTTNAYADAYDDPDFDERIVVEEGEPSIWIPFEPQPKNLIYLQQLVPEHWNIRPFAWDGKGVDPKGPAYWYYFDNPKYTCRGAYAEVGGCNEEITEEKVANVPELPSIIYILLGIILACVLNI